MSKDGTKLSRLSTMTHKAIAKKITNYQIVEMFKEKIVDKFVKASDGKLRTAADIDFCLAEIRSLGTDSSHPYLMYKDMRNQTRLGQNSKAFVIDS